MVVNWDVAVATLSHDSAGKDEVTNRALAPYHFLLSQDVNIYNIEVRAGG